MRVKTGKGGSSSPVYPPNLARTTASAITPIISPNEQDEIGPVANGNQIRHSPRE
jgi:hypothetical protein